MKDTASKVSALGGAALMALACALPGLRAPAATSTPPGFTDNLGEALATAKADGKYLYVCFSGSDWCGWCRKLEREVLSKSKFLDGVTNDFVLVYIDMPEDKSLLPDRAKVENEKLVEKYGVTGFPTALILDSDGERITKTGYRDGGARKYVDHLMDIRARGPRIRLEEQLVAKHIAPFDKKLAAVTSELGRALAMEVGPLPHDKQAAKAREILKRNGDVVTKVEGVVAEFKTAEMPAEISAQRIAWLKRAEDMLARMKEDLAKD